MEELEINKQNKKELEYRVQYIQIKKGHKLYKYFEEVCFNYKNIYNVGNYICRQLFFAGYKLRDGKKLSINEQDVLKNVNDNLEIFNKTLFKDIDKKIAKRKVKALKQGKKFNEESFNVKKAEYFSAQNNVIDYNTLDAHLKITKNQDYYSLPAQVNQEALKEVIKSWKGYFASLREYKTNFSKFTGKPKPPKYAKKNQMKTALFTNIVCKIQDEKLRFPKTNEKLNIGKYFKEKDFNKFKQVRVIPSNGIFKVEIIFEVGTKKEIQPKKERIIAIDLGVTNFATITNNFGNSPIIIKGGEVKSINQLYNKDYAKYYSIIRKGKKPTKGIFTTKKIQNIIVNRNNKILDYMHKASKRIVNYCTENNVDTIVVGKNKGIKTNINIGSKNNQTFVQIPHSLFIEKLIYKANEKNIYVEAREESYTSKASFLDNDFIPTYGLKEGEACFSGKRIKRGLYKTKSGILINADVNGSANILKKFVGDFEYNISTLLNPKVIKKLLNT